MRQVFLRYSCLFVRKYDAEATSLYSLFFGIGLGDMLAFLPSNPEQALQKHVEFQVCYYKLIERGTVRPSGLEAPWVLLVGKPTHLARTRERNEWGISLSYSPIKNKDGLWL